MKLRKLKNYTVTDFKINIMSLESFLGNRLGTELSKYLHKKVLSDFIEKNIEEAQHLDRIGNYEGGYKKYKYIVNDPPFWIDPDEWGMMMWLDRTNKMYKKSNYREAYRSLENAREYVLSSEQLRGIKNYLAEIKEKL